MAVTTTLDALQAAILDIRGAKGARVSDALEAAMRSIREAATREKRLHKPPGASSDAWCTPPEIGDPLVEFHGGPVDFDPCSNERSIILARMALTSGGLVLPWRLARPVDWTGYQNDPYSKSDDWTAKMLVELARGNVREHIRLCMMSTSTQWWADMCTKPRRNPRILALKRIAFLDPFAKDAGKKRMGCRFEPALVYFGPRAKRFDRTFAHLTRWSTWGRT